MDDYKETTHYCIVCHKRHSDLYWRWTKVKIKGKVRYYCGHGIDCYGCKKIHYNDTGREKIDADGHHWCGKWFTTSKTPEQKIRNLSPQEVMSGVQYGMDEVKVFRPETVREDHSTIHKRKIKGLKEALSRD